ncbi:MAG: acylneuraminate cytidylyltransferase family protein [Rickettsiales bacterium]|jgi:CMP-N,N'-diacetyllegionaminic acid synthase
MTAAEPSIFALIPARSGSKRVPDKNVRRLNGHPLMAYAIRSALESGIFASVIVSTDSQAYADVARHYGAAVPFLRPPEFAGDTSPDIQWLRHLLGVLKDEGKAPDCFAILRPTSPFRQAETIRRAWEQFKHTAGIDSIRAVEACGQHPGKMWTINGPIMSPILPYTLDGTPWHSNQYAALPKIYVQNASLEIAWSRVVLEAGSIAGDVIAPFLTEGHEGVDVNAQSDWWHAEYLVAQGMATLPPISTEPYPG